jgi:hypothetical protein
MSFDGRVIDCADFRAGPDRYRGTFAVDPGFWLTQIDIVHGGVPREEVWYRGIPWLDDSHSCFEAVSFYEFGVVGLPPIWRLPGAE